MLLTLSHCIVQHSPDIQQLLVESYHPASVFCNLVCQFPYGNSSIPGLSEPAVNLIILPFKTLDQSSVCLDIDREIFVRYGLDDGCLDEFRIELGIQEHVLDAAGYVLVTGALHKGIFGIL